MALALALHDAGQADVRIYESSPPGFEPAVFDERPSRSVRPRREPAIGD